MFAEEIRRAVEAAPRCKLPDVAGMLWRALSAAQVTEAEAEEISALIEVRRSVQTSARPAPTRRGSKPRTDNSMERRRRWAASGRLPPALAARFTLAEQAVLSLVAAETCRRKDCRLSVGGLAAITGVSETTVRNAIREAVRLGLITVEERRLTGWRNDTNVVRIVLPEWLSWLRLTRKRREETPIAVSEGGGCKSAKGTSTKVLSLWNSRPKQPLRKLPEGSGRPFEQRATRNRGGR